MMNTDRPAKELLAVSATQLQGVHLRPRDMLGWLKERTPDARVGPSIFVYDVTRDAEAHRRLAGIYAAAGDEPLAARERRRTAIIEKEGSSAR